MAPPDDILRKKALYAAASVVMAFGLGCSEGDDEDKGEADTGTTTDVGDDGAGTGGDGGAGTGGEDGAETPPDCVDSADPATCCEALAAWCGDTHGVGTEAAIECIYGPDFDGSTGCIPWGPPVPPRMS